MLLAAALSFAAAPPAAAGIVAFAGGPLLQPLVASVRVATAAKGLVAALDSGSLRAAVAERIASIAPGMEEQLAAAALAGTTGSIERAPAGPAKREQLLASVAIPFGRLPALKRLEPIYADMEADPFRDCRTASCENARATLETVVASNGRFLGLIGAVNRSVNKLVAYRRDLDTHGVVDYWAKPSQTLNAGVGDCEDYAILKMAVLAKAGVPAKSMSLVVLRDERRGVYHAVLAIRTSRGSYILDNLDPVARLDVELPDYMPLYSVSAGRGYIYGRRSGRDVLSASARFDAIAPGEGLDGGITSAAAFPASARGPL